MRQEQVEQQIEQIHRDGKNLALQLQKQLEDLESRHMEETNQQIHSVNTRSYRRRVSKGEKLSTEAIMEEGGSNSKVSFTSLRETVSNNINTLTNYEKTIQGFVVNLPRGKSRDKWQLNLTTLGQEIQSIKNSHSRITKKLKNYENERRLLDIDDEEASKRNNDNDDYFEEAMKEYGVQHKSLNNSERLIEQMKDVGASALSMLSDQRSTIKRIQDKAIDMAVSLGVSQSTIRSIERRYARDKYIIYIGMAIITILLIVVYFW